MIENLPCFLFVFRATLYERLKEAHYTNHGAELRQLDLAMKSRTDGINNKVNEYVLSIIICLYSCL